MSCSYFVVARIRRVVVAWCCCRAVDDDAVVRKALVVAAERRKIIISGIDGHTTIMNWYTVAACAQTRPTTTDKKFDV